MKSLYLFQNARIIDFNHETPSKLLDVLIDNGHISKIGEKISVDSEVKKIDLAGKYMLPGLIDNHVHLTAAQFDLADTELPETYIAIQSSQYMEDMLNRGFTSVRDAGGADFGLQLALDKELIKGPRLFRSGKAISQTGGHGDFYHRSETFDQCFCRQGGSSISMIADGISSVRKVVREQLRTGATQVKIMASGGIASPTDHIQNVQFSEEEIRAVVEEAHNAGTYVMAHAYAPSAITRCINNGVRTIEHGNLLDRPTAKLMKEKDAYLVPTMIIYHAIGEIGAEEGFPQESLKKLKDVVENALVAVKIAREEGVKIGFGTDLLGPRAGKMQSQEFVLRAKGSETPHQIISSATYINAEILQQEGKLGVIKEGAFADLIVVDGNPLEDISLLSGQGEHIPLVMKAGVVYKNLLA